MKKSYTQEQMNLIEKCSNGEITYFSLAESLKVTKQRAQQIIKSIFPENYKSRKQNKHFIRENKYFDKIKPYFKKIINKELSVQQVSKILNVPIKNVVEILEKEKITFEIISKLQPYRKNNIQKLVLPDQELIDFEQKKITLKELSKKHNKSIPTIVNALRRQNTRQRKSHLPFFVIEPNEIIELTERKITISAYAIKKEKTANTVRNAMIRQNIQIQTIL